MSDKKIASIFETYDYKRFKIIEGNRPIDHARKLIESINSIGVLWQPVLVNERFEIIDGQGRFLAMKTLGKPIIYVVQPGLNIEHVRYLNKNATIWKPNDFIHSYAVGAEAKDAYRNIETLKKQFPEFDTRIILKAGSEFGIHGNNIGALSTGEYDEMSITMMNVAIGRLDKLRAIVSKIPEIKSKRALYSALMFCIYLSEVDSRFSLNQLTESIKSRYDPGTHKLSSMAVAIQSIDQMYNYRRLEKNRYSIVRKYEDVMREIAARNRKGA